MSELVPAVREANGNDPVAPFIQSLEQRWRIAKALVASGMIPHKRPEAALAIMLKAYELGVPPMQAFATIHFFDGKLVMEAALMDGIAVSKLGVRKRILESTDKLCRIEFQRPGWEPITVEFTLEEARGAGLLIKDNWKKYPKDMLAARCKARGLRLIAPDFFAGTYAVEEFDPDRVVSDPESTEGIDDLKAQLGAKAGVDVPDPQEAEPVAEPSRQARDAVLFPETAAAE